MNPIREDFLRVIYQLQTQQRTVTIRRLATIFKVRAASATYLIQALQADGFVIHPKYQRSITLTKAGRDKAEAILKNRQLWQLFLSDALHCSATELETALGGLEHIHDPQLAKRLVKLMVQHQKNGTPE
ncbi:hypothetical protein IV38_GL001564 [Lactobacillus selangorensis]|uniref:Manganese transport regulator n=1 Tax=Lactobacillus selangorensis TaxID=81857 RepID=A0A0R2FHL2_9LACO|nr:metal-dependent transcriptional regulator [Lactobacillus selangorensis]KRN28114.1 hypothetical protein IV38_GL001564 [Lactobacillus selangorensis]KRN31009.1 hypothetical protein IV40_GL001651 [Lactobacillus selangorensis]